MTSGREPFAGFDETARRAPAPDRPRADPPASARAWARDLGLGARFALGGGREGWMRTVLTAVGVGLGVAVLLLAAAVPAMMQTRDAKRVARDLDLSPGPASASTLLAAGQDTVWHSRQIGGMLLQPEGAKAGPPPGVREFPAPGTMVASPALARLLADTPLLRARFPYRITGTIGPAGLMGPRELYFYAGSDRLTARDANYAHGNADRASGFGHRSNSAVMGAGFDLLLVVMVVVLLVPVGVFVATAVRLGGERRDRRLAALRLVGADIGSTRRIAAGEALAGTLLGLLLGVLLFLAGRRIAAHVSVRGISAYPADLAPDAALAALIAVAVPCAAVVVTMISLRGTAIEPLGVDRQGVGRPRRLWWRLVVPALGLALLVPLFGKIQGNASINDYQIAAGTVMLLIGVTAVLPWVVERVVGLLRGGPIAWQLATRRLQMNSGAAARMVGGVTVAVAGAIALQMLFGALGDDFVIPTKADPRRAQAEISVPVTGAAQSADYVRRTAATRGVQAAYGYVEGTATQPDASTMHDPDNRAYLPVAVADCAVLRQLAAVTACAPGDAFLVPPAPDEGTPPEWDRYLRPGGRIDLDSAGGDHVTGAPRLWTVPAGARTVAERADPSGVRRWGVLATPQALDSSRLEDPHTEILIALDQRQPDGIEYVRNTARSLGISAYVADIASTTTVSDYRSLRRGLFAGAAITIGLIGASLLVTMLEQLRERKKLLAVLVAFGTRRSALAWSVLWQTAIPVALGLVLACAGGVGLGAVLLAMADRPFRVAWADVGAMSAIGAAVVLAVTLLSLPPLWRLTRADGLRTE